MEAAEGERRPKRARAGFAIFDEGLLFDLHEELMTRETKAPKAGVQAPGRPAHRPAKAAAPTHVDPTPSSSGAAAGGAKRATGPAAVPCVAVSRDAEEQAANAHTAWAVRLET